MFPIAGCKMRWKLTAHNKYRVKTTPNNKTGLYKYTNLNKSL